MEIENLTFKTEKEYKEFLDYLFSIRDIEYRDFNTKIVVPVDCEIIGIRTPILRDIGKKIAKTSSENFLNFFENLFTKKKVKYHEEKVLYGFIIGYSKIDFQERLKRIDFFINIIDNWAVCDIVDSSFKFINKNKEDFYTYLTSKLSATNPWEQRFIFVMLLAYYVEEKYLKEALSGSGARVNGNTITIKSLDLPVVVDNVEVTDSNINVTASLSREKALKYAAENFNAYRRV